MADSTVIVAAIGAVSTLVGVAITQWGSRRTEAARRQDEAVERSLEYHRRTTAAARMVAWELEHVASKLELAHERSVWWTDISSSLGDRFAEVLAEELSPGEWDAIDEAYGWIKSAEDTRIAIRGEPGAPTFPDEFEGHLTAGRRAVSRARDVLEARKVRAVAPSPTSRPRT